MIHVIGNADEFWRLRVTRVDTTDNFDFEWHDDILYRQPTPQLGNEVELWHVEAVRTDDAEIVVRVATFADADDARAFLARVTEDLAEMTKSEFEATYLDAAETGDTGVE